MQAQTNHSTQSRRDLIPVLAFVGVTLVTLVTGNILFDDLRDGIRDEAQSSIASVGRLKANQISYWLEDRLADAQVFSENSFFSHQVMQWLRSGRRDEALRLRLVERMGGFISGNGLRSVALYDAAGRIMLRAGDSNSDEEAILPEAREVARSCALHFVDLHRHRDVSLPVGLGFLAPLREGGECFGAIYLAEDPERYLYPLVHEWPVDSVSAETLLARKESDKLRFLVKLRFRSDPPLTFVKSLDTPGLAGAAAANGKQGLLEGMVDYRGVPVLAYATAVPRTPWVLISKIDEEEAYRVVDRMQQTAAILALVIYMLIAAWFWQWRRRGQAAVEAAVLRERMRAEELRMEDERRFRTVFEHTAQPMMRNALNGEFLEVNDAWCKAFGYSREEVAQRHLSWPQVTHPDDIEPGASLVKRMLAGEFGDFSIEKRYLRKDGSVLWGGLQATLIRDEQGVAQYIICAIQDITARKELEKSLEDNLTILKMALEGAQEAVWEWDLLTGKATFSPQYYTMLGYEPDEFPATQDEWLAHIHPDERDAVLHKIQEGLGRRQELHITEYRMRAKDGGYRWIQGRGKVVAFDGVGRPSRMVGINTDITERKQSEQQISFMAYHDKLTGLPNRALLFDRLAQAIAQARRDGKRVALLFSDLDGFKAVNDEHGHEAGDTVLRMSAQRFLACVRAVDTVARFGGDEFAIILGNLDAPEQAGSVAEKIVQAFGQSLTLPDGAECKVGVSVGISIYPEHGSAMDNLIKAADHAMYESKRRGKNMYTLFAEGGVADSEPWVFFDGSHIVGIEEIDEQHRNLAYLVNRLNEAIKHDESKESTDLMFEELLLATVHHFETESRYMDQYCYPEREAHEQAHSNLVETAKQLKRQFQEGKELQVLQAVKDWLLGHIAYDDKRLGAFLRQQGVR